MQTFNRSQRVVTELLRKKARNLSARRLTLFWWAILVAAIIFSLRPPIPVLWNDTPAFVESAFRTLEMLRPTVTGGRDPGYPTFLAMTFAVGGSLSTVVVLQQAAWAALMIALAITAQRLTRTAYSLGPIILVAMYPGLLLYRNIILAETLYTVFLNLAVLALLVATTVKNSIRCWMVAAAILVAVVAACFKIQGILVAIAVVPLGVWIAWPYTPARAAVIVLSVAAALTLFATASRVGASSSDRQSVLFGAKTLFCMHANIVLASEAARGEIATLTGERADAMLSHLATDLNWRREGWPTLPTLGFFGDYCLFDPILDQYLAKNDTSPAAEIAAAYQRLFLVAILDRPLQYIGKVIYQMYYGPWFSWPPHGLDRTVAGSTADDRASVLESMKKHGFPPSTIGFGDGSIEGWILSDFGRASTYLFRSLSAAFVAAVICSIMIAARRRRTEFLVQSGIVILLWTASTLTTAAAYTLDVWRYIVPATPMVGLLLSIVGVELVEIFVAHRRGVQNQPAATAR
jgi:hypothetical protein